MREFVVDYISHLEIGYLFLIDMGLVRLLTKKNCKKMIECLLTLTLQFLTWYLYQVNLLLVIFLQIHNVVVSTVGGENFENYTRKKINEEINQNQNDNKKKHYWYGIHNY